jgi:hypothetical protein
MTTQTPDMQAVLERLEKLERQNRRLRKIVEAILLVLVALAFMGQTGGAPGVVSAHKFILVDPEKNTRAELALLGGGPVLRFFAPTGGGVRAAISANGYTIFANNNTGVNRLSLSLSGLYFADEAGTTTILLGGANKRVLLARESGAAESSAEPGLFLHGTADSGPPNIEVVDADGFETLMGGSEPVTPATGEKYTRSAASIVMFGKDNKMLWSAP